MNDCLHVENVPEAVLTLGNSDQVLASINHKREAIVVLVDVREYVVEGETDQVNGVNAQLLGKGILELIGVVVDRVP